MGNKQDRLAAHLDNIKSPSWPYATTYSTPIEQIQRQNDYKMIHELHLEDSEYDEDCKICASRPKDAKEWIRTNPETGKREIVFRIEGDLEEHLKNGAFITEMRRVLRKLEEYVPGSNPDNPYLDPLHPPTEECENEECLYCGARDCPHNEPLHYHHDGCPSCYSFLDQYNLEDDEDFDLSCGCVQGCPACVKDENGKPAHKSPSIVEVDTDECEEVD